MSEQEEIREGLISKVKSIRVWALRDDDPLSPEEDAEDILSYLHSQGVVIKGKYYFQSDLYAVEPLVKET